MDSKSQYLDRRDKLASEGKFELPLNIDTRKYLLGPIAYVDLFYILPVACLSGLLIWIFWLFGWRGTNPILVSVTPTILIIMLQANRHPVRKNVSLLKFRFLWRMAFKKRNKTFFRQRGVINMDKTSTDTRSQLEISDIFSNCYETTAGNFVKVIEVSPVNLSLMNKSEIKLVIQSYRSFLNEISFLKNIQIEQIAQPVNLQSYLNHVEHTTIKNQGPKADYFVNSYTDHIKDIQTDSGMVSRKRYLVISEPISNDREKSLKELERKTNIAKSSLENMLSGYFGLTARTLNNEELLKLYYTCLDYNNAQSIGDHVINRASKQSPISLDERTASRFVEAYTKENEFKIS